MKGLPELVIGDLKVKRPVIQGGMGVGVSLGQLAGAVAKEGGVGVISTCTDRISCEPDFETEYKGGKYPCNWIGISKSKRDGSGWRDRI